MHRDGVRIRDLSKRAICRGDEFAKTKEREKVEGVLEKVRKE